LAGSIAAKPRFEPPDFVPAILDLLERARMRAGWETPWRTGCSFV
jgi:hypothetical protein